MIGPVVLLIGCGVMGEPYLAAAKRLGYRIALVETERRINVLRQRNADLIVDAEMVANDDVDDDHAWIAPAFALAARVAAQAIVAFAEPHVFAAALLQDSYRLRGAGLRAAVASRDKGVQRLTFLAAGLPQPKFLLVGSLAEVSVDTRGPLPVVIKPLDGTGSEGVELISDHTQWIEALTRRADERLLVEEYVEAPEYSWEALVDEEIVVTTNLTRKVTSGPPDFVEISHEPGYGEVDSALQQAADALGADVLRAIGMQTGVVCLEFRADGSKLYIMEVMVRMPGDHLMEVISRTQGRDWFADVLQLSLGGKLDDGPSRRTHRAAASVYVLSPGRGTIVSLDLSRAERVHGVVRVRSGVDIGDKVEATHSSADRLAAIILDCEDRDALSVAMQEAVASVKVEIEPQSPKVQSSDSTDDGALATGAL